MNYDQQEGTKTQPPPPMWHSPQPNVSVNSPNYNTTSPDAVDSYSTQKTPEEEDMMAMLSNKVNTIVNILYYNLIRF